MASEPFDAVLAEMRERASRMLYVGPHKIIAALDRLAAAHAAELAERDVVVRQANAQAEDFERRYYLEMDRAEAAERDAVAKCVEAVPASWLDPLLTGTDAVLRGSGPWGCPDIERLLSGVRKRIAAIATTGQAKDSEQTCCDRAYKNGYDTGKMHASRQGMEGWTIQVKRGGPNDELGIWAVDPDGSSIWLASTQEKGNG